MVFPRHARVKLGKELTRVQVGLQPRDGTWQRDDIGNSFERD